MIVQKTMGAFFIATALVLGALSSSASAGPAQILIIRHGEKPDDGADLSDAGKARAQALIGYFENNPTVTRWGTPAAIYAMSSFNDADSGLRPIETVTPLAEALGLPVLSQYQRDDVQGIASDILSNAAYDGRMVLICWEHKMIGPLASALGVSNPGKYPKDDFGQVWEIDFSNDQVVDFRQYEEQLDLPSALTH